MKIQQKLAEKWPVDPVTLNNSSLTIFKNSLAHSVKMFIRNVSIVFAIEFHIINGPLKCFSKPMNCEQKSINFPVNIVFDCCFAVLV